MKNSTESSSNCEGFTMKQRIFAFVFAGLLLLSGCSSAPAGGASSSTPPAAGSDSDSSEILDTSISAPDPADTSISQSTGDLTITVNDTVLTASLADNSSAQALRELLAEGPLTIDMRDYGSMEKVGPLGTELPRNDEQIFTEAGDLILYQGNSFVMYYAPNSWNFTRLGKINNMTADELREVLGDGSVTVTLSID